MFEQAASFTGEGLEDWDVSQATLMYSMFDRSAFRTDISKWNVGNCVDFDSMFSSTDFDIDISSWNIAKAQYMSSMFRDTPFNQNLCEWSEVIPRDVETSDMFSDSACMITTDPQAGMGPWCQTCVP